MIMLDVDHFKQFNDNHGHTAGDHVLRRVAATLADVAKKVGFAARYGGEEFALILPNKSLNIVHHLADLIRRQVEKCEVDYEGNRFQVTVSVGIATLEPPCEPVTPEQFIQRADRCLYEAKRTGRNRVVAMAA